MENKAHVENIETENLVAFKISKDAMLQILEMAKDKNPELFHTLIASLEKQYGLDE